MKRVVLGFSDIQFDLSAAGRRLPTDTAFLTQALPRAYAAHNTVLVGARPHTSALPAPSPGEERTQLQKSIISKEQ